MAPSRRIILVMCASFFIAASLTAPTIAQVAPHMDTMLDISHAWISATVVGCDVKADDRVLVNGKAADGIAWDRLEITPAKPAADSSGELGALRSLAGLARPTTAPTIGFRLKPGYYRGLTITAGNCRLGPVPLVASEFYGFRRITLIAQPVPSQMTLDSSLSTGVFGDIPLLDLQVRLVRSDRSLSYIARNEDDSDPLGHHYMYFFDAVVPGNYDLTVAGFGWQRDLGTVSIPRQDEPLFRSITTAQLGLKF